MIYIYITKINFNIFFFILKKKKKKKKKKKNLIKVI